MPARLRGFRQACARGIPPQSATSDGRSNQIDWLRALGKTQGQPVGKNVLVQPGQPQAFRPARRPRHDVDILRTQAMFAQVPQRAGARLDDE